MSKKDEERIMEDFRSGKISMDTAKREIRAIRMREATGMTLPKELPEPKITVNIVSENIEEGIERIEKIIQKYPTAEIILTTT